MTTQNDILWEGLLVPGEITTRERCYDRTEPFAKHPANPVLIADRPWEGAGVYYPCPLYCPEEQLYKLWYFVDYVPPEGQEADGPLIDNFPRRGRSFLCYAQSRDGLTWDKPALNRLEVEAFPGNNIVAADSGFFLGVGTVVREAEDPDPNRRYKLLLYDNDGQGRDGIRTAVSSEGLDWTFVGDFPVLPSQDTPSLWHDRRRGQYVAFLKDRLDNRRARLVSTSSDFLNWTPPAVLLEPDSGDAPTLQFYAQTAFPHRGHDFGLLNRFDLAPQRADLELITCSQGVHWRRLPGKPTVLSPGEAGSWEAGGVYAGPGEPLAMADSCWYYYGGSASAHDEGVALAGIGVATFTPGRLVGQQFEGEGWCCGLPFRCPGGTLELDALARHPLVVSVRAAGYGGPLPGYTSEECLAVTGDSQAHAVRWKTQASLDALSGRFVQLCVQGQDSVVYGFRLRR